MADLDAPLNAAVDALFAALNAPNPDTVQALSTPAGWASINARMRAEAGRFASFPTTLVNGDRAAVRGMTAPEGDDDRPDPLWLCFASTAEGWMLDATFDTRQEAQAWLAAADTTLAPEDDLTGTVERIALAVQAGDADALKGLSADDGWDASATTPARMIRFASKGDVQLAPLGPPRTARDRAAVRMGWIVDGKQVDAIWLCLRHTDGWTLEGQVESGAVAALWLRGVTEDVPSWSGLPEGTGATAFVQDAIPKIGTDAPPPPGSDAEAWASLIATGQEGLEPRVGEAKELRALNRALVQLGFYDPDDPEFPHEDRWALLENGDDGWRLIATRYLQGMGTLLEGLELSMPEPKGAASTTADPVSRASDGLKSKLAEMFDKHGVQMGPDGKPDLTGLSQDQLEAMGPDIAQSLLGGFAAALGNLSAAPGPVPTKVAEPADLGEDIVDLAAERARRSGRTPVGAEAEIGEAIQAALGGFVGQKAGDKSDLKVDAEFLKESGPQLVGALFGALAKAMVPDNVKVPVQTPASADQDSLQDDLSSADADAGQRTVNVDLDLGGLIGGLFANALGAAARSANQDRPNTPTGDDEPPAE